MLIACFLHTHFGLLPQEAPVMALERHSLASPPPPSPSLPSLFGGADCACALCYQLTLLTLSKLLQCDFCQLACPHYMFVLSVSFTLPALLLCPIMIDPGQAHEQKYASSDAERKFRLLDVQTVLQTHNRRCASF